MHSSTFSRVSSKYFSPATIESHLQLIDAAKTNAKQNSFASNYTATCIFVFKTQFRGFFYFHFNRQPITYCSSCSELCTETPALHVIKIKYV